MLIVRSKRAQHGPDHFLRRLAACLCALLLVAPVSAQAPAPAPPQPPAKTQEPAKLETTVLRVTTHLVQISVIVQDKKGNLVTDLTRDDFALYDEGKLEKISFFSVESSRQLPPPTQPPPPDVYSNRFEQKGSAPTSVTVILLDGLNTRFEDMAYARQQVIKFLGQLQPQDRVALYTLTDALHILHDFTTDASSLLRALDRYKGHYSSQLAASEPEPADTGVDMLDQFLNSANQRMADFYAINRVARTADALEAIANHLAGLPGRKNLIWVSGSFPFSIGLDAPYTADNATQERRTFSREVDRAARALNNANLAIYPVDARGLIGPAAANPAWSAAGRGPLTRRGAPPSVPRISPDRANFDTMNVLADRTGGHAFYNTNDIQGSIRRAIDDSRFTYVLGYYPSHGEWTGKFRDIKLDVKRPGARLRYRRGYFAFPDAPLGREQRDAVLREAVTSPLDATSLGLNVHVQPVDVPGARTLRAELHFEAREIGLEQQGDRWVGALDLLFVQLRSDGSQAAGERKTFQMNLTRPSYEALQKEGLTVTRSLPIVAGATQLRVVARDLGSGALGSLTIPLTKLFSGAGD